MATKRKPLSKKIRFEVFKRDSFKCQYCGKSSPDVVLEVDHIKPVAEGGTNDLTNLITSCMDCNRGKGATLLDDKTTLEKQRKQMEELNEKRNQLKMMMEWREELMSLDDEQIEIIEERWSDLTGYSANATGVKHIRRWLKKFDLGLILDCMEISVNQYLRYKDDEATQESVEKAFNMIPRIATNKSKGEEEPHKQKLYYIRGILRNRLHYHDPQESIRLMELAHLEAGMSIESLKEFACNVKNWTEFKNKLQIALEDSGVDY